MTDKLSIPFGYFPAYFRLSAPVRTKIANLFPDMPSESLNILIEHIEGDISRYKGKLEWLKANEHKLSKSATLQRLDDFLEHAKRLHDWLEDDRDAASDMVLGVGLLMRHDRDIGQYAIDKQKLRGDLWLCINKAETAIDVVGRVKSQGRDRSEAEARRGLIWALAESYKKATGKEPDHKKKGFSRLYTLVAEAVPLNVGESSLQNDINNLRKFLQK